MVRNGIIIEGVLYELKECNHEVCKNCDLGELCEKNINSPGPCLNFDVPFSYNFKKYDSK